MTQRSAKKLMAWMVLLLAVVVIGCGGETDADMTELQRLKSGDMDVVVLAPGDGPPLPFRVAVDGAAPGAAHGEDVDEDGNGVLGEGRLYQLVREREKVRERTLEITFLEAGAQAYAFTFG